VPLWAAHICWAVRVPSAGSHVPSEYVPPAAAHIALLLSRVGPALPSGVEVVLEQAAVDNAASPASVIIRRAIRTFIRCLHLVK
jgi:hypothetical protein